MGLRRDRQTYVKCCWCSESFHLFPTAVSMLFVVAIRFAIPLALEFWATTQQAPSPASLDATDRSYYPLLISIHSSRGASHPQMPWRPHLEGCSRGAGTNLQYATAEHAQLSARPSPAQHSLGGGTVQPPRARGHTAFHSVFPPTPFLHPRA